MLISTYYFVGEINIPGTGNMDIAGRLNHFIEKREKELLLTLLGYGLYKDFTAGVVNEDGTIKDAPEQKWKDLLRGKEYNDATGKLCYWRGLIEGSVPKASSLIALYVYYWWLRDKASQTAIIGEVENNTDAEKPVSPALKMSRAWNELSQWIDELLKFLQNHQDVYPQWDVDVCAIQDDFRPINPYNL